MSDEELKEYRQMVYMQVEYLANCYPNLKWDGELTAAVWSNTLLENNVNAEELYDVCHGITKDGFEDWQINIGLIINKVLQNRKINREKIETEEYFKKYNNIPVISVEKVREAKREIEKKLRRKIWTEEAN